MTSKTSKIKPIFFFSVFCAILLLPKISQAADYYVATNGNDDDPGTSAALTGLAVN